MMLRPIALILALAASSLAWGEALDPPARIAHMSHVEGQVLFRGVQAPATYRLPDRPLAPGDRLVTERGARAELAFGTATLRLDELSELTVVALDATTVRVELTTGAANVHLRELLEDESFEIVTPNSTIALDEPGEYRVDVHARDASVLTVHGGAAEVTTAGGPVRVAGGQRVRLEGRNVLARLESPLPADNFDDWILEREVKLAEAEPPRYTPHEDRGYEALDRHGEWHDEPRYGRVWMPSDGYGGRAPHHDGYWQRSGYGWSWINPAPWSYLTFHSGRWTFLSHRNRWCWTPGPRFHGRQSAHDDTRPFGQPRGRSHGRVELEDAPRTAYTRSDAGERARGMAFIGGANRERSSAPPVAAAPRGGGGTVRPLRAPPRARSAAPSNGSQSKPAFGAPRTP